MSGTVPRIPSDLKLICQHDTRNLCSSACFDTASGDLILGCTNGIHVLKKGSKEVKHETHHHSAQVAIHKGTVFIAEQNDKDSAAEKD